jgi:hypothetical protein
VIILLLVSTAALAVECPNGAQIQIVETEGKPGTTVILTLPDKSAYVITTWVDGSAFYRYEYPGGWSMYSTDGVTWTMELLRKEIR